MAKNSRIHVISDANGRILATGTIARATGDDGPVQAGMNAGENQFVHELDVDDSFHKLRPEEMHSRFVVKMPAHHATLVDRKKRSAKAAKRKPKKRKKT